MEKVQRKRKKDDERHERKKGKKDSAKSLLASASAPPVTDNSNNTLANRRSSRDASTEKDTDSTNPVDGNTGEEGKNNVDAKDKAESDACMRQSPEPNCSICLSKLENKSFTDSCFHMFCFVCLLEWSKIKTECPLCKQPFKSIIHNVRSYDDYDQYDVQKQDMQEDRRFRYRTTLTVDRLLALQNPRGRGENQGSVHGLRSHMTTRHTSRRLQQQQQQLQQQQQQQQMHYHQLQYSRHSLEFRRSVYRNNLQIVKNKNNARYRNTKPDFLQKNPTAIHRLAPWLERELNVLLRHQESHVSFVMELILDVIKCYPISSEEFYQHILPFVGRNTSHFMHEFENFAKSTMPDMRSYDENTQYAPFTQLVDSNSEASSSDDDDDDDDDDVIVLSPRETTTATATATTSRNQSSISVSISLGHPSQQIVMTSSSWDKQCSDKSQAESSNTSNGQTSTSGWESPQPGPSGILPSSAATEATNVATESNTTTEPCSTSESKSKPENSNKKQRRVESSSDSNESEANGEAENNEQEDDSDVVITGYEKPWVERSPILISDLDEADDNEDDLNDDDDDDKSDEGGADAEGLTEKSVEASTRKRSSKSGEGHRKKRTGSRQKDRSHRKSRDKGSSRSGERARREYNFCSAGGSSFENSLYNKRIRSRSRSKSRSTSRSRRSKSKNSGSGYSNREKRSRRQRHHDDSPTSSSSSLQLHISQRSIFGPLSYSNVYRLDSHQRRTLNEHSSNACDYDNYLHKRLRRKHRFSHKSTSPTRHPSRGRSRSSSVEIIAYKRQRKNHKKHKKHKHRKHHRSKRSSKVPSSACGSISDSNIASGSDVVRISPPPTYSYKKHHSGHKNSHLRQSIPRSPTNDDVHIIATVRGEGNSYLSRFQKYTNSLQSSSSGTATASCTQSAFKDTFYPVSPLRSHPSSPIIDAETIGADVVIPSEGNGCQVDLDTVQEKLTPEPNDMPNKAISVPVSTCGNLDEINDPDLKLMIPDLMNANSNSPLSPLASKPDCIQTNCNTSASFSRAPQTGLPSCALESSKWLPLPLSSDHSSPLINPDCRYSGKTMRDLSPFIEVDVNNKPHTPRPSATVTLCSADLSDRPSSNNLNLASSAFASSLLSSESNSSFSSTISVVDHTPIIDIMKPFSVLPIDSPEPSTSMASFQSLPLRLDEHDLTSPMPGVRPVNRLNHWTPPPPPNGETSSATEQQSLYNKGNLSSSHEDPSSGSLLESLSTICSSSVAKLSVPAENNHHHHHRSDLNNLLPLYNEPLETCQQQQPSSSSSLSTLAAAASLAVVPSPPNRHSSPEKTICNTTSLTLTTTTPTSETTSSFSSLSTTTATATTTSVATLPTSPNPTKANWTLTPPERKAPEEATHNNRDLLSLDSDVGLLHSRSGIASPREGKGMNSRSPSVLALSHNETPSDSGTNTKDLVRSFIPGAIEEKLLIEPIKQKSYEENPDDDDEDDEEDDDDDEEEGSASDFITTPSNLPILNKNSKEEHKKQPEEHKKKPEEAAASSSPETDLDKMAGSLSPHTSSDIKPRGESLYEYSSHNLTSNQKSPLKITLKRLKPPSPWIGKTPQESSQQVPHSKRNALHISALSNQNDFSDDDADSQSSHQDELKSDSELKPDQNPSTIINPNSESTSQEPFNKYSIGRAEKTASPRKTDSDILIPAHRDSSYQTDPATGYSSQDNLFDESSSDESNVQSCENFGFSEGQPTVGGLSTMINDSPAKALGNQSSKSASLNSSQIKDYSEDSSSGSDELEIDLKEPEGLNCGLDNKATTPLLELHSQGDISDDFNRSLHEKEEEKKDSHALFSSSKA